MPPRRTHAWENNLTAEAQIIVRWETERDVVRFAVMLLAAVGNTWRTVVLFDCSHDDRNDRHRYTFDGVKGQAETFHRGTPGKAMRDATHLIRTDYRRMIEQWRR